MVEFEVLHSLTAGLQREILHLVDAVAEERGERPMSDQLTLELEHPGHAAFHAVLAREHGVPVGYCQLSNRDQAWTIEMIVPASDAEVELQNELMVRALDIIATYGAGSVRWWVFGPSAASDAVATAAGLTPERTLFQMRRALPLDSPPSGVVTRPFRVGKDEAEWLDVNNTAFASHPEQGQWDLESVVQREAEPWFDPSGFLIHERDGRMAAFCWTKVHHDLSPVAGEIYVIAVHPDFHGLGLGRALTVAGLEHLESKGITVGMLYVDGDNVAAVTLYEHLGFEIARTDRAYTDG